MKSVTLIKPGVSAVYAAVALALFSTGAVAGVDLGEMAENAAESVRSFGNLVMLIFLVTGIVLAGLGVLGLTYLRKNDPQRWSIGMCTAMIFGGGVLLSLPFFIESTQKTVYGSEESHIDEVTDGF